MVLSDSTKDVDKILGTLPDSFWPTSTKTDVQHNAPALLMVTHGENVYTTFWKCLSCVQHYVQGIHYSKLHLLLRHVSLELMAMNILGPLLKKSIKNHFLMEMTDRYSKLTGASLPVKTTASQIVTVLFDQCFMSYVLPSYFWTKSGPQFVGKFCTTKWSHLRLKRLATTAYYPQEWKRCAII